MRVPFSEYGIKDLMEELTFLDESFGVASEDIVKQIVDIGGKKANELNNQVPPTGEQKSTIETTYDKNKGSIALVGSQAIYEEFGTGEEGADDGHPLKGNYGLNPYNSGPYVSTHISESGRHYWYSPVSVDSPYVKSDGYTEGSPSGKQMYRTTNYILEIKDDIAHKELNKAIKAFNKVIKK